MKNIEPKSKYGRNCGMALVRIKAVTFIVDATRDSSWPNWARSWPGHWQVSWSGCFNDLEAVLDQTSCFLQTIAINITLLRIHWLTQSWNSEQHFLQLETSQDLSYTNSIWFDGWRALIDVNHNRAPSIIIGFHNPSWCENGLSLSITIKFHHSCDGLIFLGWNK